MFHQDNRSEFHVLSSFAMVQLRLSEFLIEAELEYISDIGSVKFQEVRCEPVPCKMHEELKFQIKQEESSELMRGGVAIEVLNDVLRREPVEKNNKNEDFVLKAGLELDKKTAIDKIRKAFGFVTGWTRRRQGQKPTSAGHSWP